MVIASVATESRKAAGAHQLQRLRNQNGPLSPIGERPIPDCHPAHCHRMHQTEPSATVPVPRSVDQPRKRARRAARPRGAVAASLHCSAVRWVSRRRSRSIARIASRTSIRPALARSASRSPSLSRFGPDRGQLRLQAASVPLQDHHCHGHVGDDSGGDVGAGVRGRPV